MLDSLLDGIKGQVASAISEKAGIDLGQAEQTVPLAGESIKEGLMGAVSGGDLSGIMGMFSGGDMAQSSIFQTIAGTFMGKLGGLGIGGGSASMISSLALPMIMNKIKGAASNDAGEVSQDGLMSVLGGGGGALGAITGALSGGAGGAGGALGAITGALGGGAGAAGGALSAITGALGGGAKDAADGAGGLLGGLMDSVTGGAEDAGEKGGDIADDLKDKATDLLKGKLGGLFGK